MSTQYDRLPTLEERVRASTIVVTGRVQSIKPLPKARIGEIDEEQAIAQVVIDKTLQGKPSSNAIDVRFVSSRAGQTSDTRPPFSVGQRLVLMLVPDVGREARPNTYVAYLRGAFPVTANDAFMMETESETSKSGSREVRVTLAALREAVKAVAEEVTAESRSWARFETELAKRPLLPSITELPDRELGAGPVTASPVDTARPRSRKKK